MSPPALTIAIIGFGEVGTTLARGFSAAGSFTLRTYDVLFDDAAQARAMHATARESGVHCCATFAEAAQGAQVVISCVTASSSTAVARQAGEALHEGQWFLDLNSVSPRTKRLNADVVAGSGARYVEAAVMAAIRPAGIATPMLLGGAGAHDLRELLASTGMKLELFSEEIGGASAVKMCRSIMMKGLEALSIECLLTARMYGVEDHILSSLERTYPQMHWNNLAGYLIERVVQHGRRRAAEMREVAATVEETGLAPLLSRAIAERQDSVADWVSREPELGHCDEEAWRATLDRLAALAGLRSIEADSSS